MTEKTIKEALNAGFNSTMAPISQIRAAYGNWSDMGGRKYSTVAAVADRKHQQNFLQELDYKMKDRKLYVQYSADGKNPILEPFYCEETGTKVLPNQNGYVPLTNKAIVDEEDRLEELKLEKLSKMIKRAQKSDKRACETMDIDEDLYNFMLRPVGVRLVAPPSLPSCRVPPPRTWRLLRRSSPATTHSRGVPLTLCKHNWHSFGDYYRPLRVHRLLRRHGVIVFLFEGPCGITHLLLRSFMRRLLRRLLRKCRSDAVDILTIARERRTQGTESFRLSVWSPKPGKTSSTLTYVNPPRTRAAFGYPALTVSGDLILLGRHARLLWNVTDDARAWAASCGRVSPAEWR
jgi:hypothetical protein